MAQFVLKIDDRGLKAGFVDYQKASNIALTRTLTIQAALTRKNAIKNIEEDFVTRNTWTRRQIQFDKARETSITSQAFRAVARAGATKRSSYMALQETGGQKKALSGGSKIAIAQRAARGGSSRSVVQSQFRLRKMSQGKRVTGNTSRKYTSRKARNVARLAVAFRTKKILRKDKKFFQVTSFRASGGRVKAKMRLLYTLEHDPVRVKSKPWLLPATRKPVIDGPAIYKSQLKKLFRSAKII